MHWKGKLHLRLGPAFTFSTNIIEGKAFPCLFFSSPSFPTFFSSETDKPHCSGPQSPVWFPRALACHMSTCLPTHVAVCATVPGRERLAPGPAFLSPSVRMLPRPLPCWRLPSAFPSLQTRWWDLTKPSVCLSCLHNLCCLGGEFNLPPGCPGGVGALGPNALFPKGYAAWHLCFFSFFNIWTLPHPSLGGPYCVPLTGVW